MLTGRLEDFSLAEVFRLISLAKKTGTLRVERRAGRGTVHFRRGDVILAESSLVREPLGQKLVRSGALTEGQLRRALDAHVSGGERIGRVLVEAAAITPKALEDAVRGQTEEAVFDLLRWELGEFTWEPGAGVDAEVPIAVSVENLIMEASRRLDELDVIARRIPSTDCVVALATRPPEGALEINITPDEWRLLILVDGTGSVRDIARSVGVEEFDALRTLYGLVAAGLVEVVPPGAQPPEARGRGSSGALAWLEPLTIPPGDAGPVSEAGVQPRAGRGAAGEAATGAAAAVEEEKTMDAAPVNRRGDAERVDGERAPSGRERAPTPEVRGAGSDERARDEGAGAAAGRKRVEDDEHVTKGLVSRFIDGVKGL